MTKRILSLLTALALCIPCLAPVSARALSGSGKVLHSSKSGSNEALYYYNTDGNCVRKEIASGDGYWEYTYYDTGILKSERHYRGGKLADQTDYDSFGNICAVYTAARNGRLIKTEETVLTYDSYGRLLFRDTTDLTQEPEIIQSTRYEYYGEPTALTFGSYEQDGNTGNGPEPIEWEILDSDGESLLLISRCGLDSRAYHGRDVSVSWAGSDLRSWLNGSFLTEAFTDSEQKLLQSVTLEKNAGSDRIFLLSADELNRYYSGNSERLCIPTAYAVSRGAYVNKSTGGGWWLLRTPGKSGSYVMSVNSDGTIDHDGGRVTASKGSLRPVLRVHASVLKDTQPDRISENRYWIDRKTGEQIYLQSQLYTYFMGRLSAMQDYQTGDMYTWEYDSHGNQTGYTELCSDYTYQEVRTNSYDFIGRLTESRIQVTRQETGRTAREYTETVRYRYDVWDRVSFQEYTYKDGSTYTQTWTYNNRDQVTSRESCISGTDTSRETWEYDSWGNLLRYIKNGRVQEENTYVPLDQALWKK